MQLLFLGGLGTTEIILIALVVLVLFGARKIPEFMKGLGQGVKEFKNASNNIKQEIHKELETENQPKTDKE